MKKTKHAKKRSDQRGISKEEIDFILNCGYKNKKSKAYEYYIPKDELQRLFKYHKYMINLLEKINNKAVLVDNNEETIITTYCMH